MILFCNFSRIWLWKEISRDLKYPRTYNEILYSPSLFLSLRSTYLLFILPNLLPVSLEARVPAVLNCVIICALNNPPEESQPNADCKTRLRKRKASICRIIISVPWSCSYHYTIHKDLEAENNGLVMETRSSHNLNTVHDHYYQLQALKFLAQSFVLGWNVTGLHQPKRKYWPSLSKSLWQTLTCIHFPFTWNAEGRTMLTFLQFL